MTTPGETRTLREAYATALSSIIKVDLNPDHPMPMLLGLSFLKTRLNPGVPGGTICTPTMLLRCPGYIELHAPKFIRKEEILDVQHTIIRGKAHTLMAMSDSHMEDDLEEIGCTRLNLPPNEIGWAFERAAQRSGAKCRQWKIKDGTRAWKGVIQETRAAEINMGLPPGSTQRVIEDLARLSPQDAVDLADYLDEFGFIPPEWPKWPGEDSGSPTGRN